MQSGSASSKIIAPVVLGAALLFSVAILPAHASAQTTYGSIETNEILPPGQNTCQAVAITDIEPHVYGGILESFDVTISDTSNSYVGILAQVGNTPIPLDYITRWAGIPSGLRIHVDTPDIPVNGVLPVSLTLLASPSGAPTCITTVSFNVGGSGITVPSSAPTTQVPAQSPVTSAPVQASATVPSQGSTQSMAGTSGAHPTTSSSLGGSSSSIAGAAVTSAANAKLFESICSGSNAYWLWFILLVVYIIIVAAVVFAEPWFLEDSVLSSTAAILIPLVLLLAFWYFSEACRAASWIPVLACVIAIIGLFLAFREYETTPLLPAPSEQ